MGDGPAVEVHLRRTALAQARLSAAQPHPSPDARRDRADHPNSSQAIDHASQAIVTTPETAIRPRPRLLSEAEKRALVQAK
jgi:hypothetical protein